MDELFELFATGELESIYNRGKMYEFGNGVEINLDESLKCYKANVELHLKADPRLNSAEYYKKTAAKRLKRASENYNFDVLAVGIKILIKRVNTLKKPPTSRLIMQIIFSAKCTKRDWALNRILKLREIFINWQPPS